MKPDKIFSIRYLAIIGILAMHFLSSIFHSALYPVGMTAQTPVIQQYSPTYHDDLFNFLGYSFLVNLFKPATILFFIISGYLFEINFSKYRSNGFLSIVKKKFHTLLKPYLIVFAVPTFLIFLLVKPLLGFGGAVINISAAFEQLVKMISYTSYWFIPVLVGYFFINFFIPSQHVKTALLISAPITLFISLSNYLSFGGMFLSFAIPGFISFFFLGRWLQMRKTAFVFIGKNVNIALVCLFLFTSNLESYLTYYKFYNVDFLGTLRISNLFYSLSLFHLMVNHVSIEKIITAKVFKPYNSYFIYLLHPFFVSMIDKVVIRNPDLFSTLFLLKAIVITTSLIIITFLLSKQVLAIRLSRNTKLDQIIF